MTNPSEKLSTPSWIGNKALLGWFNNQSRIWHLSFDKHLAHKQQHRLYRLKWGRYIQMYCTSNEILNNGRNKAYNKVGCSVRLAAHVNWRGAKNETHKASFLNLQWNDWVENGAEWWTWNYYLLDNLISIAVNCWRSILFSQKKSICQCALCQHFSPQICQFPKHPLKEMGAYLGEIICQKSLEEMGAPLADIPAVFF